MLQDTTIRKWNDLKIGLVLSGGGAKGAYECGVIQALEELDIMDKVTIVSGTSIGALNTLMTALDSARLLKNMWQEINYGQVAGNSTISGVDQALSNIVDTIGTKILLRPFINQNPNISMKQDLKESFKADIKNIEATPFSQENILSYLNENFDMDLLRTSRRDYYVCAYNRRDVRAEYFDLKRMTRDDAFNAVLASCAIPHVYPTVYIKGIPYSDGGINDSDIGATDAANTPIKPLVGRDLDFAIVVYLSNEPEMIRPEQYDGRVISIVPSQPLELLKSTGTMNFTQTAIGINMELGYRDAHSLLAPMIFKYLKGHISYLGRYL